MRRRRLFGEPPERRDGRGTRSSAALATSGEITIDGTLDVASHRGGKTGPAANGLPCIAGTNPADGGGGQGGSFGSLGGDRGDRDGSSNSGGRATAMSTPTQLLGGCSGADGGGSSGSAGSGGGAVLLIGGGLTITGTINASGSGGSGARNNGAGGGGGGASGLVMLDAPTISVSGSIFAHGGRAVEAVAAVSGARDPLATIRLHPAMRAAAREALVQRAAVETAT